MLLTALATVNQPLSFDIWTLIFQSANVLVIMLVLYKFLWQPLQAMMEEREQTIEDSLNHAAESKAEAERLLEEYETRMREAHTEAAAIVDEATAKAEAAAQRIAKQAEEEAEQTMTRAREEIERERQKAVASLREEMTGLVVLAAGKVIDKTLDEEDHKQLVRQFVDDVAATDSAGADEQIGDVQ